MAKVKIKRRMILEAIRREKLRAGSWLRPGQKDTRRLSQMTVKSCKTCAVGDIFRKLVPTANANKVSLWLLEYIKGKYDNSDTAAEAQYSAAAEIERGNYLTALSGMFETLYIKAPETWRKDLAAWVKANLPNEIVVDIDGFVEHLSPRYKDCLLPESTEG